MPAAKQSAPKWGSSPFLNPQFSLIFIAAFLIYMSSSMLIVTLPKFAHEMGVSAQAIGLLAGIFAMCAMLMRPISGQIVDTENKIRTLRIVLAVLLISVFGLTMSTDYWMLLVFRGLNGFAWGVGSTLCMTIASGCFTPATMAGGIGLYGLGQVLAQTIAPLFALPIAQRFGYNALYYGNVALIATCMILTLFMRIAHIPKKRTYSIDLRRMLCVPALAPAGLTLVNSVAKSAISAFLVIFAGSLDIAGIGMYFTLQAATIFVVRPWISKLADRIGPLKVLIPCELLIVTGMLLVSGAHSLPAFLVAAVVLGIAQAGEQPILMAECVKSVDASRRGNASNTSYLGVDIGMFVGSNVAGFLVAGFGYRNMFRLIIGPLALYSIYYFGRLGRRLSIAGDEESGVGR